MQLVGVVTLSQQTTTNTNGGGKSPKIQPNKTILNVGPNVTAPRSTIKVGGMEKTEGRGESAPPNNNLLD